MKHIDIKKKLEELRLKVGVRFNLLDLEKYINDISDESVKKEKLLDLIEKYKLIINQDIINLFKDKEWFKEIFFTYASDELLLDEKNKDILNAILYENKEILFRNKYSREVIIKLIKTNCSSNAIDIYENEVEKNDYELLRLMKEHNSYFKVRINKDILKKCIELKINPYLISNEFNINKLIIMEDNSFDLELVNTAIKNNITLVNIYTNNYDLIKKYLDAGIDIEIPNVIYEKNLIELYKFYPQKVIEDVKKRNEITMIFSEYLVNNKIEKIDDNVFEFVVYNLNASQILENIDKIKNINLEHKFTFFSSYSDEKKEYLKKIIESGFPNIIKYIDDEYIDEEIMNLALTNGFSDYYFIFKYFPDKLNEPQVFDFLHKLIINYDSFNTIPYDLVNKMPKNRDVFYNIITQSQNKEYINYIYNNYLENNLEYFFEKLKKDNNKMYYANFFSNIYSRKFNDEIINRIIEEYKNLYNEGRIDLNLFEQQFFYENFAIYSFESADDIKKAFDSGFKDIFYYIKEDDIEKWIKYAIKIHYTTNTESAYGVKEFLKNNMNYLHDIVKINPVYINVLESQVDIENNIDLIHECINIGIQPNNYIKKYLILNESEKVYTYKLLPRINYLLDNVKNENNNVLNYINEKKSHYSEGSLYIFESEEESLFIKYFNDNINNQEYKEIIITYIKKNISIPRNLVDKVSSNNEIMAELIDYNINYIRYATDEYIENNKNQLIEKIINSNNVGMYIDYSFVRAYLKNIKDINEIIRIKRDNNVSYIYFDEEIINNNSYLKNEKNIIDNISDYYDEIMDNPSLILSDAILFKRFLEQNVNIDIEKFFKDILIINDNISNILKYYPNYLKSIDVSKFSNNFIEKNYQLFLDNGIKLSIETRAYLFNNCESYRDKYKSYDEINEISNYIIYDKIKNDNYILRQLISLNDINIIKHLNKDLETIKRLVGSGYYNAIDLLDPTILLSNMDLCEIAISKGYKIDNNTSLKLLNNIELIKMLILKNLNSLDMIPNEILNDETNGIVEFAFNNGYKISDKTPKIILSNLSYVKKFILTDTNLTIIDKINFVDDKLLFDESNGLFDILFSFTYITFNETNYINNIKFIKLIIDRVLTLDIKYANLVDVLQYINIDIIDDDLFDVIANNENLLKKLCNNSSIYSSRFINEPKVIDVLIVNDMRNFFNKSISYLNENSIKYIVSNYANYLLNYCHNITELINKINDSELKSKVELIKKIKSNNVNLTIDQQKLLFEDSSLYSLLVNNRNGLEYASRLHFTDNRYKEKMYQISIFYKLKKGSIDFSREEIDIILENEDARDTLMFYKMFGDHQQFKDVASEESWNYIKIKIPNVIKFYEDNNVDEFTPDNFKEVYDFSQNRYFQYLSRNEITDKRYYTVFNNNIDGIIDGLVNDYLNSWIYIYVIDYLDENDFKLLKDTIETKGYNFSKYVFDSNYKISINSPEEIKDRNNIIYAVKNFKLDFSNGLLIYGLSDEECKSIYDEFIFNYNLANIFCNDEYKKYYNNAVIHYIEFSKNIISNYLNLRIKSFDDLYNYYDDDGPKKNLYEEILCNSIAFEKLLKDEKYLNDYIYRIKPSAEILQYIKFVKENGFILEDYIKTPNDINAHFSSEGPKELLYEKTLLDLDLFNKILGNDKYLNDYINRIKPTKEIQHYIIFIKDTGFILKQYIKTTDEIKNNDYFNENGPTQEFYEKSLFDSELFDIILRNDKYLNDYINRIKPAKEILYYIKFTIHKQFILKKYIKNVMDIKNNFIDDKINKQLFDKIFTEDFILATKIYKYIELTSNNDDVLRKTCIEEYLKIENDSLKEKFLDFILRSENGKLKYESMTVEQIRELSSLFEKMEKSNSVEIRTKCVSFANLLLSNSDDIDVMQENYSRLEKIFLENNLPYVGKVFKVFETLYPNYSGLNLSSSGIASPVLVKTTNNRSKDIIIFSDLLRCALGSNNRSIKKYLESIEIGENLFNQINEHTIDYSSLSDNDKIILSTYCEHLKTLYMQTKKGKDEQLNLGNNVIENIEILSRHFSDTTNVKDRLVRMFLYFTYFSDYETMDSGKLLTFEQVKAYIEECAKLIDTKNREFEKKGTFTLEEGDFVKGIGEIKYLGYLLNNGSVAREYLGASAGSDATPLDADFSIILSSNDIKGNPHTIQSAIAATVTNGYGPIWLVLKNRPDRFTITRRSPKEKIQEIDERRDLTKLEMFCTGAIGSGEHYGLRTGCPSGEIDYIITDEPYDYRIGLEIAMNGFYIPVVNKQGNLLFTSSMYDEIIQKMAGLSYYEQSKYVLSDSIHSDESKEMADLLKNNEEETRAKREALYRLIDKALEEFASEEHEEKFELKTFIDGDLSTGSIELLDTGSTGRKTNMPGDGDFDLMMRVDQRLLLDSDKLQRLKQKIIDTIDPNGSKALVDGDIREYKAIIDVNGVPKEIEIDITFIVKSNNNGMIYPTEECVKDRLKSIREQYPADYDMVIANILLAKKLLKGIVAYKPNRKDQNQGGMGGVGVENWILQNGGSLLEAAREFIKVANSSSSFEEFKQKYRVDDFGVNHMAEKKGIYPHDNFIFNMNSTGYEKMKRALQIYIDYYDKYGITSVDKTIEIFDSNAIYKQEYEDEAALIKDIAKILEIDESEIKRTNLSASGRMYEITKDGKTYIIKPGVTKDGLKVKPARVEIQSVASKLQQLITPDTALPVISVGNGSVRLSMQEKITTIPCDDLIRMHSDELFGEYVVDYLLGNYDADGSNFIVDSTGKLRGIDKEQGLKYLMMEGDSKESLNLDFSYKPSGTRGALYSKMFNSYINGEIELNFDHLYAIINILKKVNDEDYIKLFKDYVYLYGVKKPDDKLQEILNRKKYFIDNIENFITGLLQKREQFKSEKKF